jgi:peptidoglycan/LPS O-acetylase OafA/YrhL
MSEQVRYANIDALRGFAATLVIVRHASDSMCTVPAAVHTGAMLCNVSQAIDLGRVGVVAFFAISGFVIYPTLRGALWDGTQKFLIRRFFRIYPAYWLSLIVGYLILWMAMGRSLTPAQLCANASMLSSLFGAPYVLGQYWTLEVELVFYVLIVGMFVLGVIRSPTVLAGVVIACIALQTAMVMRWVFTGVDPQWGVIGLNVATMFWGALFRQWHDTRRGWGSTGVETPRLAVLLSIATLAIAVPLAVILIRHRHPESMPSLWGHALGMCCFAMTVLFVRGVPKVLAWLGAISYSLYLLHPVVMHVIWRMAMQPDSAVPRLGIAPLVVTTIACSVVVAAVSYYGVERPAIATGRRLTGDVG